MDEPVERGRSRISRRSFARQLAGAAGVLAWRARPGEATTSATTDVFDEALERFRDAGPEYGGGLANHGPMAAEALVALGRPEAVLPWVETYRRRLDEPPAPWKPIEPERWRESLGEVRHAADWPRFFEKRLAEAPWPEVLEAWVGRLAPGIVAAALHGVIRAGHAVRALAGRDTPARRRELAAGLGYWAMRYQTLPDSRGASATLPVGEALSRVPLVPEERRTRGFITERLRPLFDIPSFASVADLLDTSGDPSRVLSEITRAFAADYLADSGRSLIALVHAVTGPSALRPMLPYLSPATARTALRYAWQAAAAIHAAHARPAAAEPAAAPVAGDREDLVGRAVAAGDEHAIKFTEVCLREHAISPAPVFLAAAADACRRLG
jgi:hypothetical protein